MLNAIYFYRMSHWLYCHHIPVLPKLITLLIFLIYNSKIPPQAKIGKGSKFGYGGISVVIHQDSVIGERTVASASWLRSEAETPNIRVCRLSGTM